MSEFPIQSWTNPELASLEAALDLLDSYNLLDDQVHLPGLIVPHTPHCSIEKIKVEEAGSPPVLFERPANELIRITQFGGEVLVVNFCEVTADESLTAKIETMTSLARLALVAIRDGGAKPSLVYGSHT